MHRQDPYRNRLLDLRLSVTVEIGRTTMSVANILRLEPGVTIELDRMTSSPVDVIANGKIVARGEIIAVDERFGIRITESIASPTPMLHSAN